MLKRFTNPWGQTSPSEFGRTSPEDPACLPAPFLPNPLPLCRSRQEKEEQGIIGIINLKGHLEVMVTTACFLIGKRKRCTSPTGQTQNPKNSCVCQKKLHKGGASISLPSVTDSCSSVPVSISGQKRNRETSVGREELAGSHQFSVIPVNQERGHH